MDSIRLEVAVDDGCMKMDVMKSVYLFQIIFFAPTERLLFPDTKFTKNIIQRILITHLPRYLSKIM